MVSGFSVFFMSTGERSPDSFFFVLKNKAGKTEAERHLPPRRTQISHNVHGLNGGVDNMAALHKLLWRLPGYYTSFSYTGITEENKSKQILKTRLDSYPTHCIWAWTIRQMDNSTVHLNGDQMDRDFGLEEMFMMN